MSNVISSEGVSRLRAILIWPTPFGRMSFFIMPAFLYWMYVFEEPYESRGSSAVLREVWG